LTATSTSILSLNIKKAVLSLKMPEVTALYVVMVQLLFQLK